MQFENRHIGPSEKEQKDLCQIIGTPDIDTLINNTIPPSIRLEKPLEISAPLTEEECLAQIKEIGQKNSVFKSYIGQGYYNCYTPTVILRNIMENPGWYTQYTPYQAEISQGRLEALLNYQTMITELTGLNISNASLLDEGTAAAEAMVMLHRVRAKEKKEATTFLVSPNCFPQTLDILKTRAIPLGITLKTEEITEASLSDDVFGLLLQNPDSTGQVHDFSALIEAAHSKHILSCICTDLLSLCLIKTPGEMGADVAIGSSQRFGVPMGFGGPHAAFIAAKEDYSRSMPGRIIGVTIDKNGDRALRMALQTREQHIRKDKATSNICTAQALLANMAGMYAVYHGPEGLKRIANRVHNLTATLSQGFKAAGYTQINDTFFDTLTFQSSPETCSQLQQSCTKHEINLRYDSDTQFGISVDETTTEADINQLLSLIGQTASQSTESLPDTLRRDPNFLTQSIFNDIHSESQMLRYLKYLENKDLSLNTSMIPLGSCTMKLNATTEMIPVTWPEFGNIHPFVPADQAEGYLDIIKELESDLAEITGFDAISLQPNSGAQGEYAGLIAIRNYFESKGDTHRNIALVPTSAHGTNPASAVMAGFKVVAIKCLDDGSIDINDLKQKCETHKDHLGALMITYPSTYGVFESAIKDICRIVHEAGGQVYMDGANMNAQVGLTNPATIGADVCHLNLHKTFAIPHGGGGPGMGPIGVAKHLAPHIAGHPLINLGNSNSAISAAPWGSASILLISYAYIKMLGSKGLENATRIAILNANYIKARLEHHYDILFKGENGHVAHELIIDLRPFKKEAKVDVEDIAKRLMDYGFHAPTISWPVPGTMMIEPTESEDKAELDRFCDTMISIHGEIQDIISGNADAEDNVLKNAPHTAKEALCGEWTHSYSAEKAVFPLPFVQNNKFWPSVSRINQAHGDRNLICTCGTVEEYQ